MPSWRISAAVHKYDLTQHQIAQQMGLSRPKIARLLQEARRTGIVRIEITQEATLHALRSALGSLILENLKETTSIGFSFSRTIGNLRRQGIVGEMSMRFFNLNGTPVRSECDSRVISVAWDTLARAKNLTVVSSGAHKIRPTLGALKTGIIHTLVTDLETARQVLNLHRQFDFHEE